MPEQRGAPGDDVPWWRRAVAYQIYPRSFADGNGDGTGDIAGIRSRLRYLQALGVNALWFNPWYASPLADGGYDVADYRQLNPRFGTVEEAAVLIGAAHELGLRTIVDVVPNHTSDQHRWFREALAAEPGSPARRRYHFLPGTGPDRSEPPNDWTSVFGGSAWTRVDGGEWYLHLFAPEQPDLNWHNDEVLAEFDDVLRFWLDREVDGFRVDVAHGMVKDMSYPDLGEHKQQILGNSRLPNHPYWDRHGVHAINRRWRAVLDEYDGDRMMVAEAWVRPESYGLYLRPDEYHQVFNFDLLQAEWDAAEMAEIIQVSVDKATSVGSTPTWVLSNHDVMREATRYGLPKGTTWRTWPVTGPHDLLDPERGLRRARAAALLMLGLPGSAYVYQGEELGLPEVWDLPEEVLDDPVWERSGGEQKGRDGCRVPIPWAESGPSFGFGDAAGWLPQPDSFAAYSVEAQTGVPGSTLELFRRTLVLRSQWAAVDEEVELFDAGSEVLAFRRGSGLRCVVNMSGDPVEMPDHDEVLLASEPGDGGGTLAPDTAVWLR
ncbi:MAG: glycoside hydrolase family 13 protein [Acidimicrobiia bacterium]|nr:glycoside hydrolase family 13 protein [Acidimicrobiia bacterium]